MAQWYRLLFPMPPREVRALCPSEVASILGLDRTDAVVVVPLTDEMLADTGPVLPTPIPKGQRLRGVVSHG
jgi:hypothetical protein